MAGDTIPRDGCFLEKLREMTGGEPIFLRYLVDDVVRWGAAADSRLDDLPSMKDVGACFEQQFAHLRGEVWELLGLIAAAKGPKTAA
jgi:hypothetical protein